MVRVWLGASWRSDSFTFCRLLLTGQSQQAMTDRTACQMHAAPTGEATQIDSWCQ